MEVGDNLDLQHLYDVIKSGDVDQAQQLAANMAATNRQELGGVDKTKMEQFFRLKVTIENCNKDSATIKLDVKKSYSVADLKHLIMFSCGFPTQTQYVVIRKRIADDKRTLESLKIAESGKHVFVYLRNSENPWPTKEDFEQYRDTQLRGVLERSAETPEDTAANQPNLPHGATSNTPGSHSNTRGSSPQGATASRVPLYTKQEPAFELNTQNTLPLDANVRGQTISSLADNVDDIFDESSSIVPDSSMEGLSLGQLSLDHSSMTEIQPDPPAVRPKVRPPPPPDPKQPSPAVQLTTPQDVRPKETTPRVQPQRDQPQNRIHHVLEPQDRPLGLLEQPVTEDLDLQLIARQNNTNYIDVSGFSEEEFSFDLARRRGKIQGWQCPKCTYENKATANRCELCFSLWNDTDDDTPLAVRNNESVKPSEGLAVKSTDANVPDEQCIVNGWECNRCTVKNIPSRQRCEVCDQAKPGSTGEEAGATNFIEDDTAIGWECPRCTLKNIPTRPGCEVCGEARPANYVEPENVKVGDAEIARLTQERLDADLVQKALLQSQNEREQRRKCNRDQIVEADSAKGVVPNTEPFECMICFDEIAAMQGATLRECIHSFCRDCLAGTVQHSEETPVKCPYQGDYTCNATLQEREIKELVTPELFEAYLRKGLQTAEAQEANSFHCKSTDCRGWCIYDDENNFFKCPICGKNNCLTCKVIHENQDCKEYQEELKAKAVNDASAKATQEQLEMMIKDGEAMYCPKCHVTIMKKGGCDWLKCSVCRTEICWVRKMARWGPNGRGDNSGGCRCKVNGKQCHPNCQNCH